MNADANDTNWLVDFDKPTTGDYPPPGDHELRLVDLIRKNLGRGPRLIWVMAFVDYPEAPAFRKILTPSFKTTRSSEPSNSLRMATALNDGVAPTGIIDARVWIGRTLMAAPTFRKANGHPGFNFIRSLNGNYETRLLGKIGAPDSLPAQEDSPNDV